MIIAFTGKKQSGKSTICEYLKGTRVNFKDALIRELKDNFTPLLEEFVTYYLQAEGEAYTVDELFFVKPPFVRKLMQCYGTEVRRGDDPMYWIRQWVAAAKMVEASNNLVLTDDVRFHNEAKAVRDCGGVVIRIVRTDIVSTDNHQSEAEMDEIVPDYTITVGKGDFVDLYSQMDEILMDIAVVSE